jgi:hypothetical protein
MVTTPWSKPAAIDPDAPAQLWVRDAHLQGIDVHLMPVIKRRRWTVGELAEYCAERRRLRFLDSGLIERWLEDCNQRGLVCPASEFRRETEQVWQVTDRGYGHGFVSKFTAAVGLVSAGVGILAGAVGANATPLAVGVFLSGVVIVVAYLLGAVLGDRSGRIKKTVLARELEVGSASKASVPD